jgi:chaperonin GroEL (HSP60 family)
MPGKQLLFGDEARDKIRRGVQTLADAVMVTLGPRGRTVILEREMGSPQIVNSGVVVARSVELEDPFENMGAQLLREVAARTSEMAGDGTTTATVLAHRMIHEGLKYLAAGMNPMELKRGIELAVERVVAELGRLAQPCAGTQDIAHVASIRADNDRSWLQRRHAAVRRHAGNGRHRPGQGCTGAVASPVVKQQPRTHATFAKPEAAVRPCRYRPDSVVRCACARASSDSAAMPAAA